MNLLRNFNSVSFYRVSSGLGGQDAVLTMGEAKIYPSTGEMLPAALMKQTCFNVATEVEDITVVIPRMPQSSVLEG